MGFFSRKKKGKKNPPKEAAAAPSLPAPVVKIVGDSKHVTTTRIDEHGRRVTSTNISKLTPDELQRLQGGVPVDPMEAYQRKDPPPEFTAYAPAPQSLAHQQMMQTPSETITNLPAGDESLATIDITRELVKKFISDIWNRGEIELIPEVCHPSLRFNGHVGMDRVGHEGFARMVTTVREALTDYHCEIHSMVVETNKAFCRLRFTGKHTGNLLGYPATNKTVAWMGASEFTCKNGKILKVWELGDVKSLEDQLRNGPS